MANSYNELFGLGSHTEDANLVGCWPCQDDAASTTVDDLSSNANDGTASANTSTMSQTGPNGWLAKSLRVSGSAFTNTNVALNSLAIPSTGGITIGLWIKGNSPSAFDPAFGFEASASSRLIVGAASPATTWQIIGRNTTNNDILLTNSISATSWKFVAVKLDDVTGGTATLNDDGTDAVTDGFSNSYASVSPLRIGSFYNTAEADAAHAFYFDRVLTETELGQIYNGPELNYSSGVSFGSDGAFDVGTWALPSPFASGSNGTATYEVIAVKADGTSLDTATTATGTLDLSANAGNTCYLLVRVSNTGGYDIGDKATRTSSYGSSNDGYYEIASVTAASGGSSVTGSTSDGSKLGDSVTCTLTATASVSEGTKVGDTVSSILNMISSVTEGIVQTDTVDYLRILLDSVTEGVSQSDSMSVVGTFVSSVSEGAVLSDTNAGAVTYPVSTSDGSVLGDTNTGSVAVGVVTANLLEGLVVSDSKTPVATLVVTVTDGNILSDANTNVATLTETISEGSVLSDTPTNNLNMSASTSEGVSVGESYVGVTEIYVTTFYYHHVLSGKMVYE